MPTANTPITLSWDYDPAFASLITGFNIQYFDPSGVLPGGGISGIAAAARSVTMQTGLPAGTYRFVITAQSQDATSDPSAPLNVTVVANTPAPAVAIPAPTNLRIA
jgi:hypothetical protein